MKTAPLQLAFLWHHHQPDYRGPDGRPRQPWARLHSLRGYRDLAVWLLEEELPMTVNLVASLLEQWAWYAAGGDDPHLALSRRDPGSLEPWERQHLAETFVAGHPALCGAHAPYRTLQDQLRRQAPSDQQLRDLQVWSNLAWVGWSGLRDCPELASAVAQGAGFSEGDKQAILGHCADLWQSMPALYRELSSAGVVEIASSPLYHPILPLLVDAQHGARCVEGVPEDLDFRWPQDALLQLRRGRQAVEEVVGQPVVGLWPSEGSLSPELLPLIAEAGFRWVASDEELLSRSQREGDGAGGPWELGQGVVGFFRSRGRSDAIGFRYAQWRPEEAVEDLLRPGPGGLELVALDGENPWESYADAGEGFMRALGRAWRAGRWEAHSLREASSLPPRGRVHALHTGSWIHANFNIWIGHSEDHQAWRLLAETREAVHQAGDPPEALEPVLAAEGSDWFWWYGDDFETPFAGEFDRQFRDLLRQAWDAIGRPAPPSLSRPIKRSAAQASEHPPSDWMDGEDDSPLSWERAGRWPARGGSMAWGERLLLGLRYGWSREGALSLRLELEPGGEQLDWRLTTASGEEHSWPSPGGTLRLAPQQASRTLRLHARRDDAEVQRHPPAGWIQLPEMPQWWV